MGGKSAMGGVCVVGGGGELEQKATSGNYGLILGLKLSETVLLNHCHWNHRSRPWHG